SSYGCVIESSPSKCVSNATRRRPVGSSPLVVTAGKPVRAHDVEEALAVAFELRPPDADDLEQRVGRARLRCRNLPQRDVVKDDVRRHALLGGVLAPAFAQ